MLVVTGTALTKNTPVKVLKKLDCGEPNPAVQEKPTGLGGPPEEQEGRTVPETQAEPDSVSPNRE